MATQIQEKDFATSNKAKEFCAVKLEKFMAIMEPLYNKYKGNCIALTKEETAELLNCYIGVQADIKNAIAWNIANFLVHKGYAEKNNAVIRQNIKYPKGCFKIRFMKVK